MLLTATTPPQEVSRALVTSSTEREHFSCYPLLSLPSPPPPPAHAPAPAHAHARGTSSADRELLLARTGSAAEVSHKALAASGGVAWAKAMAASSRPSAQSGASRGPGDAQHYRGVTREEAVEGFRAAMQQSLQGHHSACDGPEAAGALPATMQQSLHVSALAEGGDSDGALGSARPSHERQDHHTRQDHRMRQDHHTFVRHEADGALGSAGASARLLQGLDTSARHDDKGVAGDASRPSHELQDHHMRQDHHTSVRHEALERMDEQALRTLHAMLVRHSSRSANG